jgi:probable F420-dependent oxidoreductase
MKLGAFLPQNAQFAPGDVITGAKTAEDIGYDSVWLAERVLYAQDQTGIHRLSEYGDGTWPEIYRGMLDPIVAMSMAVAATSRVTIGSGLIVAPLHVPFRLARSLASMAAVSGGRVVAGLGTGWSIDEFEATAPRPMNERGAALDEFLDVAEALWAPDPVSFKNERYTLYPAEVGPKPDKPVPVLLGGWGKKARDRAVRRANAWMPVMLSPADIKSQYAEMRDQAAELGRELSCVTVVAHGPFQEVPSEGRQSYTGSMDQVIEDLAELSAAGVSEAVLTLPNISYGLAQWTDHAAEFYSRWSQARI